MINPKAQLRAMRDLAGLSQQDLAEALGVALKSVKRWEQPHADQEPPEVAFEYVQGVLNVQREQVTYARRVFDENAAMLPADAPKQVVLTYYRDQKQYDDFGRDPGSVGQVNAATRAIALALEGKGADVFFAYPNEGAMPTPGSRYR